VALGLKKYQNTIVIVVRFALIVTHQIPNHQKRQKKQSTIHQTIKKNKQPPPKKQSSVPQH
jgi:hypothetical protein